MARGHAIVNLVLVQHFLEAEGSVSAVILSERVSCQRGDYGMFSSSETGHGELTPGGLYYVKKSLRR